jgi:hypothetical protein
MLAEAKAGIRERSGISGILPAALVNDVTLRLSCPEKYSLACLRASCWHFFRLRSVIPTTTLPGTTMHQLGLCLPTFTCSLKLRWNRALPHRTLTAALVSTSGLYLKVSRG